MLRHLIGNENSGRSLAGQGLSECPTTDPSGIPLKPTLPPQAPEAATSGVIPGFFLSATGNAPLLHWQIISLPFLACFPGL